MTEEQGYEAAQRAEAEARRKKIMEKSKSRMDKVSGLQAAEDEEPEEAKKTSSAARMQAMRRRRFKKGGKAKAEDSAAEGETAAATPEATEEPAAAPVTEDTKPEAPPAKEETAARPEKPTETKVEEPAKDDEGEATAADTTTTTDEAAEPKKKYKGVAKMRREKMLQKKKEEAAKAAEEEAKVSESPGVLARQKKRMKQPMLPIIMYIFTSFLLFLAGLDVGLQHADPEYVLVNRNFAPQNFNIQKLIPWSYSTTSPIKDLDSGDNNAAYGRDVSESEDEFGTPKGADDEYIPNIDPLFQVDLDELTKGPGVFNQLARGAIRVHRMILYVVWDFPLQMLSLPSRLFRYPPVMCLAALTIRQLIAKMVLGARLPDPIEEDVRNTKGEITDVLTMIKNAITNTVSGLFPTAISAYEVFQHLRIDMYVILFGMFVGLLCSTWSVPLPHAGGDGMPVPVIPKAVVPDVIPADTAEVPDPVVPADPVGVPDPVIPDAVDVPAEPQDDPIIGEDGPIPEDETVGSEPVPDEEEVIPEPEQEEVLEAGAEGTPAVEEEPQEDTASQEDTAAGSESETDGKEDVVPEDEAVSPDEAEPETEPVDGLADEL